MPFPGPVVSQTLRRDLTLGNNILTASFATNNNSIRLAEIESPLNGFHLKWTDPNLFTIYLTGGAKPLASSEMKYTADTSLDSLHAAFTDEASGLHIDWHAVMPDGANYLLQEIDLTATKGPVAVDRVEMLHGELAGARVSGPYDGMPIITDKLFLGVEHPMAQNHAKAGKVTCDLPRRCELKPGMIWKVTAAIGVYPQGQLRRAFLYYLERQRAHPYRQYWHYNSWFDLNIGRNDNADPLQRMTEAQCLDVITAFGRELHEKRGVGLDGFVWDDGWDDWNSLWSFHKGFPNGFTKLAAAAARQGAGMGAWLSPWGGYGGSHNMRVRFGREKGYETNAAGFSLGGANYYAAFRDTCLKMIRDYHQNYFKFDGIGGGTWARGAPVSVAADLDGLLRLTKDLHRANRDVFINCTVGTWPSPYWTWYADSIWRGGDDFGRAGEGNPREQWITYRDGIIHDRFAAQSPLYPLNSLMYHGLIVSPHGGPAAMPTPKTILESFRHEVLMSVGCGSGLGELYVTPSLMTPTAWDILAEALKWSRAHRDILRDTHWIGGKPGSDVYGYAAWHPRLGGTVVLRNPNGRAKDFAFDPSVVFELPPDAPKHWVLSAQFRNDVLEPIAVEVGKAKSITLQPYEVLLFNAQGK
jgi:hypothetical protein